MGKFFLACVALIAIGLGLATYEDSKLNPAQKHAKECQNHTMAAVMALGFARTRLNLAERPEFETSGTWKIAKPQNQSERNCSFAVTDHITFKNEMGGRSRRHLHAIVAPDPDDPGVWRLRDLSIR